MITERGSKGSWGEFFFLLFVCFCVRRRQKHECPYVLIGKSRKRGETVKVSEWERRWSKLPEEWRGGGTQRLRAWR